MRTNIDIDDKLMRQAMKATGRNNQEGRGRGLLAQTDRAQAP